MIFHFRRRWIWSKEVLTDELLRLTVESDRNRTYTLRWIWVCLLIRSFSIGKETVWFFLSVWERRLPWCCNFNRMPECIIWNVSPFRILYKSIIASRCTTIMTVWCSWMASLCFGWLRWLATNCRFNDSRFPAEFRTGMLSSFWLVSSVEIIIAYCHCWYQNQLGRNWNHPHHTDDEDLNNPTPQTHKKHKMLQWWGSS